MDISTTSQNSVDFNLLFTIIDHYQLPTQASYVASYADHIHTRKFINIFFKARLFFSKIIYDQIIGEFYTQKLKKILRDIGYKFIAKGKL